MSLLLHGDCLEQMKGIDTNSVDFIFCDLPYGQTSCKWDVIIPWEPFWNEILRIKKLNTPIFFTTTTKFGVELINNAPKKCPFRYDLVWVKSAPAGFLSAKKMPMRKHEMVYCFYEKLPFYDLSSHKHKFLKSSDNIIDFALSYSPIKKSVIVVSHSLSLTSLSMSSIQIKLGKTVLANISLTPRSKSFLYSCKNVM